MCAARRSDPAPQGRVRLNTSRGPLDIVLFAREAPLACKNFVQHALNDYYKSTDFTRVVRGYIVQGGDPSGTGLGGASALGGETFKDEIHSRLRFGSRGCLAMANRGERDSNGSQFILTLDAAETLHGRHTLFGKVVGESVYTLAEIGEVEVLRDRMVEVQRDEDDDQDEVEKKFVFEDQEDDDIPASLRKRTFRESDPLLDRPVHPVTLLSVDVIENPFPDVVRNVDDDNNNNSVKEEKRDVKTKKATKLKKRLKNKRLLSFDNEEEQEEQQDIIPKKQAKVTS